MQPSRRQFVGGAVSLTAALSGCSALGSVSDGGGSAGTTDEATTQTQTTAYVEENWIDDTVVVEEDYVQTWDWTWDESWTIEYEFFVRSGPPVDVFLVTHEEYEHFQDGDRFKTEVETMDATSGEDSVTLEPGGYRLVVDNTESGEAEPPSNGTDDPAEVEVNATVRKA